MPELPEVETVRADLDGRYGGLTIGAVQAPGIHRLRRHTPAADFVRRLSGRTLLRVDRRGKYLVGRLDNGDALVAHLGMSGQLRAARPDEPFAPHSHVVIDFDDGGQLRMVDPRTFGELWLATTVDGAVPELAHLGPDALEPHLTWPEAAALLAGRRARIKPLLMDQRFVAGIGNIYADEILWTARIAPDRPADGLVNDEVRRLWRARRSVLSAAVALRGSTLGDAQYRDLAGSVGGYQARHQAYGREGLACRRCGTAIVRSRFGARSSFACPTCQPPLAAGRVPAPPPCRSAPDGAGSRLVDLCS